MMNEATAVNRLRVNEFRSTLELAAYIPHLSSYRFALTS
jgi:hypothetical protein